MKNLQFVCPDCGDNAKNENIFCGKCEHEFDFFENHGVCTACGHTHTRYICKNCVTVSPMHEFYINLPPFAFEFSKRRISAGSTGRQTW
jgi:predicted amidophosphoribosyltransferase